MFAPSGTRGENARNSRRSALISRHFYFISGGLPRAQRKRPTGVIIGMLRPVSSLEQKEKDQAADKKDGSHYGDILTSYRRHKAPPCSVRLSPHQHCHIAISRYQHRAYYYQYHPYDHYCFLPLLTKMASPRFGKRPAFPSKKHGNFGWL